MTALVGWDWTREFAVLQAEKATGLPWRRASMAVARSWTPTMRFAPATAVP